MDMSENQDSPYENNFFSTKIDGNFENPAPATFLFVNQE